MIARLYNGDCLEVLDTLEEESIDNIITDPPYELNFLGKGWDNAGVSFRKQTWEKMLRVLKPGGYLLAFGGSRTFHRIAVAIEDAGFEIRDVIMWLYGSGFPKSMNVGKAVESKMLTGSANTQEFKNLEGTKVEAGNWGISKIAFEQGSRPSDYAEDKHLRTDKVEFKTEEGKKWEGWGSCLKPAFEPIIVARKPFKGSLTDNVLTYGVGALNIEGCKIGDEVIGGGTAPDHSYIDKKMKEVTGQSHLSFGQIQNVPRVEYPEHVGRFPANVIHDGLEEDWARYFYCAKASKQDREEGLNDLPTGILHRMRPDANFEIRTGLNNDPKWRPIERKNTHPTVKPTQLMRYLVKLVSPKGAIILDPFMGSGSTGKAVALENEERDMDYQFVGIEMSKEYYDIAKARIETATINHTETIEEVTEIEKNKPEQLALF